MSVYTGIVENKSGASSLAVIYSRMHVVIISRDGINIMFRILPNKVESPLLEV